MTERLVISRLGWRGDGIADAPDGPLYVPYALPGETVEVAPWRPDRRRLVKVVAASAERIAPICPHFGTCGGCALQHLAGARYRDWKRALVVDALAQAGLAAPVDALIEAHGEGRRRAVFHARRGTRDVLAVGFSAFKAHQVVAIDRCPILAPGLAGAIPAAWAIAEALGAVRKPLDIQVTATDAGLDVDVRGSGPLPAADTARLAAVAAQHRLARLTRHGEIVAQHASPTIRIGRAQRAAAAGRVPAGDRGGGGGAGQPGAGALRRGANGGRPVRRRGTVRAAPCRAGARHRRRRRCRRGGGIDERGGGSARPQADPRRAARPVPPSVHRRRARGIRRRGARSAAAGCRSAGARARRFIRSGRGRRSRAIPRPSPAMPASSPTAATACCATTPIDQFLYSAHVELVALFRKTKGR